MSQRTPNGFVAGPADAGIRENYLGELKAARCVVATSKAGVGKLV